MNSFERWIVENKLLELENLWKYRNGEYGYPLAKTYWDIWEAGYCEGRK